MAKVDADAVREAVQKALGRPTEADVVVEGVDRDGRRSPARRGDVEVAE